MEDINIARQTKTRVVYSATGEITLPPNAMRLSVRLVANGEDRYGLYAKSFNVGAGVTINVPLIMLFTSLTATFPTTPWYGDASLETVGNILLGDLVVLTDADHAAVVIETYLDVHAEIPLDQTKLAK